MPDLTPEYRAHLRQNADLLVLHGARVVEQLLDALEGAEARAAANVGREDLARIIAQADALTLGDERRLPDTQNLDDDDWVGYLPHADAVAAMLLGGGL